MQDGYGEVIENADGTLTGGGPLSFSALMSGSGSGKFRHRLVLVTKCLLTLPFSAPSNRPIEISSEDSDTNVQVPNARLRVVTRPDSATLRRALTIPDLDGYTEYSLYRLEDPWP